MKLEEYKTEFSSVDNLDEIAEQNEVEMETFDYSFYKDYSREELLLLTIYSLGKYREQIGSTPLIRMDDITVQFFLYFPDKLQISSRWPFPKTDLLDPILKSLTKNRSLFSLVDSRNEFDATTEFILTRQGFSQIEKIFTSLELEFFELELTEIIGGDKVSYDVLESTFPFRPDRLKDMKIYNSWETDLPPAATIVELSKILDISRTSPFKKYIEAFDKLVMYWNLYDPESYTDEALSMTKFMILQAFYRYDYLEKSLVEKLTNLSETFEIQEEAKEAKKIILDDIVASV